MIGRMNFKRKEGDRDRDGRGGEHQDVIDCKGIRGEGERKEGGEGNIRM